MEKTITREIRTISLGIRAAKSLFKTLMAGFNPETGMEGLNSTHFRTLVILDEGGRDCMKCICGKIGLEAGSFTPVADRLMAEGLIDRIPDGKDRRRTLLTLTDRGRVFTDKLKNQMEDHLVGRLSSLDGELLGEFLKSLELIMRVDSLLKDEKIEQ